MKFLEKKYFVTHGTIPIRFIIIIIKKPKNNVILVFTMQPVRNKREEKVTRVPHVSLVLYILHAPHVSLV